ncbi:hypothetical protein [Paraburkholderia phenoliruptrix]|uniref:hypothetical protein n=1 Tax=Paraburkholderia phenoliruptrix TaxID=252970 RepID=UPI00285BAD9F|nr:hypothetical protein [Paraburkholderia phenoliruptrix]MDR6389159.1 hypothetical protein [Paraburkholderia phenoliruptrix]
MIDPNHDIVPTLRMFDGLMMNIAADEIEKLRARVKDLEARAAASAQATQPPDPTDIQGWSVTVNVNAQDILTIGHNNLSGIDNIGEFADVVRNCAEHLVSFIGATPPSPDAREAGGGVTLTDEQRKWVMDAALILANSVSAAERQVSSKLLALLREAGSGK